MKAAYMFPLFAVPEYLCLTLFANNISRSHSPKPPKTCRSRNRKTQHLIFMPDWMLLLPHSPVFNCSGSYNSPPSFMCTRRCLIWLLSPVRTHLDKEELCHTDPMLVLPRICSDNLISKMIV